MVSAPRLTNSLARNTAFLPGHPPQLVKPVISISVSIPVNTPVLPCIALKSPVPGQKSSVCLHLIIPNFILPVSMFQNSLYIVNIRHSVGMSQQKRLRENVTFLLSLLDLNQGPSD